MRSNVCRTKNARKLTNKQKNRATWLGFFVSHHTDFVRLHSHTYKETRTREGGCLPSTANEQAKNERSREKKERMTDQTVITTTTATKDKWRRKENDDHAHTYTHAHQHQNGTRDEVKKRGVREREREREREKESDRHKKRHTRDELGG